MRTLRRLTPEQETTLRELRGTMLITRISEATGIPRTTIGDFYQREDRNTKQQPRTQVLDNPVRPLAIEVPEPASVDSEPSGSIVSVLLYGDTHFPEHDPRALDIILQVAADAQPDVVVHVGDLVDAYPLSRFDKNPDRLYSLQDEINQARVHLAQMRKAVPDARIVLLEGNHEDRLRRTLWNLDGPAAALAKLTQVKQAMTWPALLGLDELYIDWVSYSEQPERDLVPGFLLKHGNRVSKRSGYSAAAEMDTHRRSGASGHTHRLGVHWQNDDNGTHAWIETGCTCRTNPEYVSNPNWQQGFVNLHWDTVTKQAAIEPVEIRDGRSVWGPSVYSAGG